MASPLDLQEQEQLDALKAFWNRFGTLITTTLLVAVTAYAGWLGWQWYQRDQGYKAGAMFDELERAVQAKDAERAGRIAADLRQRYPGTAFAGQGALAAARIQFEQGQADAARARLQWAAESGKPEELQAVARLRLAGLDLQAGKPDDALTQLAAIKVPAFAPLAADRRGDALLAQGKVEEAKAAYQEAWKGLDAEVEYRRVVEAKLDVLGAPPAAAASAASGSGS